MAAVGNSSWSIIAQVSEIHDWMFDEALCSPPGVSSAWLLLWKSWQYLQVREVWELFCFPVQNKHYVYGVMQPNVCFLESYTTKSLKVISVTFQWLTAHLILQWSNEMRTHQCDVPSCNEICANSVKLLRGECVHVCVAGGEMGGSTHNYCIYVCSTDSTARPTHSNFLLLCWTACVFLIVIHSLWAAAWAVEKLTLGEPRRVVIDIREPDSDGGGPW